MREVAFVRLHQDTWREVEHVLSDSVSVGPDRLAELYVKLTDDLAYASTYYPGTKTFAYINDLTARVYHYIYKNRKERRKRFLTFWTEEVPLAYAENTPALLFSLGVFVLAFLIGVVSTLGDDTFVRLILGDSYVNMTIRNIKAGNPLGVYQQDDGLGMVVQITLNNLRVDILSCILGLLASVGTAFIILYNGIMVGTFFTLFGLHGSLGDGLAGVMIHGTIELTTIVLAGAAGFVIGNGIMFPGTYTRLQSFVRAVRLATIMLVGVFPFTIVAGILESFVTRWGHVSIAVDVLLIVLSAALLTWYFILLPRSVRTRESHVAIVHTA
ncbi:MAG: stage II sporulation protein M ['Candidatus Kapabacteria' thiocyanatum]|uniref:Stage II sporulation protein M n=1 Tax=Candidatus Kapaibacterium thiocyanatum TaxID=1895771 RepID=A0A1M3L0B6_9BACT|nr:stage II sporulation protein M ['Candidatus Kapabacteria' thiocyanatum]OJX58275.1 MAG: hypothetical protein BGO89_03330 ['Candidatus Kapabacteria' thiocyanatum]